MIESAVRPTAARIQNAALALFARQGYEATTLAQIADAVGIRKPSLYNHIQHKEGLYLALVDQVEAQFFAVQDASLSATAGAALNERLYRLITDLSDFIFTEDSGAFYKRCLLFPPDALADEVRAVNDRSEARIDTALRALHAQGVTEGHWRSADERVFLDAFYCLMDGLYSERFIYSRAEYTRRLASAWRVFWRGVSHTPD
ncbi:TetR/AcrR family transcriptional regulator [Salinisphaera sp. T31B1]|uniref:TetR/AcrR family transcriptional regulator n=1 Tax=Salinisphaera sp. T31B1 TaxID=727963 RepID=UPI003342AF8B